MKKLKKNIIIAALLIFSVLPSNLVSAAYVNNVIVSWDRITNLSIGLDGTEREVFKNITFLNGYTYTESKKDTTTAAHFLLGSTRYSYTRTYKTY